MEILLLLICIELHVVKSLIIVFKKLNMSMKIIMYHISQNIIPIISTDSINLCHIQSVRSNWLLATH